MRRKKDILFLCQFFYPEYISSATLPYDTANALIHDGYTVDVLCGFPKEYLTEKRKIKKRETINGIGIHRVSYLQLNRKKKIGRVVNYFSFTASILLHFLEIKKYKVVIVYSNPPMLPIVAAWAKRCFGCKIVFVAYDLYPELAVVSNIVRVDSIVVKIFNRINNTIYSNADRVVALSSEMKSYISNNRPIKAERVSVIPNWYDDEGKIQKPNKDNIFYEKMEKKFVISYLGNMGTLQDISIIVKAIIKLKDDASIHFLFAGHGNKYEKVKEIVLKEKLENVTICGYLQGKDYKDALAISSCAIVSLIPRVTGLCCPSKTYGYMMQGIPLIVIMGDSDIADDAKAGAGEWIKKNDADELVDKIILLKEDCELRDEKSRKCREIFLKKYTEKICTKKYVELMKKIV